jgi:hypothetical protein
MPGEKPGFLGVFGVDKKYKRLYIMAMLRKIKEGIMKSDFEQGYEAGEDAGNGDPGHDAARSFSEHRDPFTSSEFKDGFDAGLDSHNNNAADLR